MKERRDILASAGDSAWNGRTVSSRRARWNRVGMYAGFIGALALILVLGLRFPQEMAILHANQAEIRDLQEANNDLRKRRDEKRARLKSLRENHQEQELEVRKELKMLKPGETRYVVPAKPQSAESAAAADSTKAD